jgi:hypothetical protein
MLRDFVRGLVPLLLVFAELMWVFPAPPNTVPMPVEKYRPNISQWTGLPYRDEETLTEPPRWRGRATSEGTFVLSEGDEADTATLARDTSEEPDTVPAPPHCLRRDAAEEVIWAFFRRHDLKYRLDCLFARPVDETRETIAFFVHESATRRCPTAEAMSHHRLGTFEVRRSDGKLYIENFPEGMDMLPLDSAFIEEWRCDMPGWCQSDVRPGWWVRRAWGG